MALVVKASDRYHAALLKGLRAIAFLSTRRILIYTGRRSLHSADGIEVCPTKRFAAKVSNDSLLAQGISAGVQT